MCNIPILPAYTTAGIMRPHKLLTKLKEVVSPDIFFINNKALLCIVDYYSKFPVVKKIESISTVDLI